MRWPAMGRPMIPKPMNPMLPMRLAPYSGRVGLRSLPGLPFGLVGSEPAEARRRRGRGLVFAADPAAVAQFIDAAEKERVIDLAGPGFVAPGIVGELDVADAVELGLDGAGEIALHHLRMVDVVLELDIGRTGRCDDGQRRTRAVYEEFWNVAGVDGLQQQADFGSLEFARGITQVLDQRGARRIGGDAVGQDARETVDLWTMERSGVVDRPFDARAELRDPVGMAGDAAFAGGPVAGRQIVQHERQP